MERNLIIAMCIAALAHIVLLSITVVSIKTSPVYEKNINVRLLGELKEPDKEEEKPIDRSQAVDVKQQPKPARPDQYDIIVAPSLETPEQKLQIQTSPFSQEFNRWLESETDRYRVDNPESAGEFSETFKQSGPYISPPELSPYNGNPVPRGRSVFATELGGKRTCFAKILNLSDISASPSFVSKDCTPPKKFELDMNKPNNG